MVSKVGLTTADDSFSVAHLLPEAQGCSTIAENTHFPDTAGIPSLHPLTTFLFSLLSPFFRAVKVNSGVCGERGTAGRSLRLKRFQKKMLLYAFLIGTGKKKITIKQSEWFPSNTLLICFLARWKAPAQMSWPTSEGGVDHSDPLPRRVPYPQGDLTRAPVAPFNSPPMD